MARHPQPRLITLGGREAVALTPQEYRQLLASRRQIGGQSARVRVLAQQVKRTETLLRELEDLVGVPAAARLVPGGPQDAAPPHTHDAVVGDTGPECLRCAIAALLRSHRQQAV